MDDDNVIIIFTTKKKARSNISMLRSITRGCIYYVYLFMPSRRARGMDQKWIRDKQTKRKRRNDIIKGYVGWRKGEWQSSSSSSSSSPYTPTGFLLFLYWKVTDKDNPKRQDNSNNKNNNNINKQALLANSWDRLRVLSILAHRRREGKGKKGKEGHSNERRWKCRF